MTELSTTKTLRLWARLQSFGRYDWSTARQPVVARSPDCATLMTEGLLAAGTVEGTFGPTDVRSAAGGRAQQWATASADDVIALVAESAVSDANRNDDSSNRLIDRRASCSTVIGQTGARGSSPDGSS